jgi:2,3-dihydroxybenzoate decarboxylase
MRKIALEEHFYTEGFLEYLRSRKEPPRREVLEDANHNQIERAWDSFYYRDRPLSSSLKLLEMGPGRISDMDRAGIDIQVLSLSNPGVELFGIRDGERMAKETNDELAKVIQKYPKRFLGFAALSPADPRGAAAELERAVKELGFKGANINSHVNGEYLDEEKYRDFEKAQSSACRFIHPREPLRYGQAYSKYPDLRERFRVGAEVSLHAMRLICGGVFDAIPSSTSRHLRGCLLDVADNRWSFSPLKATACRVRFIQHS